MTTNGVLLAEKVASLRDAGLTRVSVSLDALDDALFRRMTDSNVPVDRVLQGIAAASAAGLAPLKVNTVVERGVNESQILSLVRYFKGTGVALRFIEFMDVGGALSWTSDKVMSTSEVRSVIETMYPLRLLDRESAAQTAVNFEHADGGGQIGFIASVSQPFCGDCARARVSSDGTFYNCLFATQGMDLKPWLRGGIDALGLRNAIHQRWALREDRYSELRATQPPRTRPYPVVRMSLVGG